MIERCDFCDAVIAIISARLLWMLAIIVTVGWIYRLRLTISYAPPRMAKITAICVFGLLAYFYLMVDFASWPTDHYQALSRVIFLLLMFHEIMHHIFIFWLNRRLNGV